VWCRVIDAEGRWAQARRLLHDDALKPEDRVAGLLVLLYAQQPPPSAASLSVTSSPAAATCTCGSARNPSNHSPVSYCA
jgi:hypothetical protein